MRPIDLDDTTPPEPDDTTRAGVHARTRSLRRRRRGLQFGSSASLVVVVVLIAALAWPRSGNNPRVIVPATSPSTTTTALPLRAPIGGVVGKWRPISITGYGGVLLSDAVLNFQTSTSFDASNGCNSLVGEYLLGADGHFGIARGTGGITQVLCTTAPGGPQLPVVPNWAVIEATARVAFSGVDLVLFAADGHELARYAPIPSATAKCVFENALAPDVFAMPTPVRLSESRVYGNGAVHLEPPAPDAVATASPASAWRAAHMYAGQASRYEIVLASYSQILAGRLTRNGHVVPNPTNVLAWVVIGQAVPLISFPPPPPPGTLPTPWSCGIDIQAFDAKTGIAVSFGWNQ